MAAFLSFGSIFVAGCATDAQTGALIGLLGAPPSVVSVVLSVVLGFAGRRRFRL
jgi:hypothetical protein